MLIISFEFARKRLRVPNSHPIRSAADPLFPRLLAKWQRMEV